MFWYALFSFFLNPAAVSTVSSLNPDEFAINTKTHTVQQVWNASFPKDADRLDDQSIAMADDCAIVLSSKSCTQYQWECTARFKERHAMSITVRTTRTEVEHGHKTGIEFLVDEHGLSVSENGHLRNHVDSIRFDDSLERERILITSFAGEVSIRIGCDLVYTTHTTLDATSGILIQSLPNAPLRLVDIVRSDAFEELQNL